MENANIESNQIVWYLLTGAMALFGTLAFFFFKSYLAKIEQAFSTLNTHLSHIETTLKDVNTFIARQDEKNTSQLLRDTTQDNNIIELFKRVTELEKLGSARENRISIIERGLTR